MEQQVLEVLQNCTISGKTIQLPDGQLERKIYQKVAAAIDGIGGKWNRKSNGFIFASDPTELLAKIQGGDKINLKKEYQMFFTPEGLADNLVDLADIKAGDIVGEPSAGQGAIVKAIHRKHGDIYIDAIEINRQNCDILGQYAVPDERKYYDLHIFCDDFLTMNIVRDSYHKIIANPPFSKNQDIDHVAKMWFCLKKGGRIVSVMSNHWRESDKRKETEFREWLESINGEIHEIEAGTFKESGTNIAACIVLIDK